MTIDPSCGVRPSGPTPWVLRVDGAATGMDNMAADEALLEAQRTPSALPVLRLFRWERPTLTFGRLQDHHEAANRTMILGAKSMARRPTGGGSVVHDKDLSFSLTWRRDHPAFPACLKNIYRGIHETVRDGLKRAGVETTLHAGPKAPRAELCYEEPVEDDVMWKGKKVLGGALRVSGWGRLYQGNLLWTELGLDWNGAASAVCRAFEEDFFRTAPTSTVP